MAPPRLLVVQHTASEGALRLGDWLTDAGVALDVVHPYAGADLPSGLDGYAGLLVLGGPQAAYADEGGAPAAPWLPATKSLLRSAVAAALPTLAICLGAQLLAEALGGRVRPGASGPEIGARLVARRDVAAQDELFGLVPFTPDVLQWHDDEIAELPPGAVLLASSPMYANQAFRVGERAWGLQFHIETTPELVTEWAAETRERLTALGIDVDRALAQAIAVHDDLAEAWRPVGQRFAALVVTGVAGVGAAP
ncbi:MAG: GMP synthase [Pseudonocardiales bacterium]|nr:MAG: GMP synthase [Pseudonocardiales bacterium]